MVSWPSMDFYEAIRRRRTTRRFTDPVAREVVSRFATTFTPYEGEEPTEPLHELSNLE